MLSFDSGLAAKEDWPVEVECDFGQRLEAAQEGQRMATYERKYEGARWIVAAGQDGSAVARFALEELYAGVSRFVPYVVEVLDGEADLPPEDHLILAGTPEDSRAIAELARSGEIRLPDHEQGYILTCGPSPRNAERKAVIIAGRRPAAVMYGVEDFLARVLYARIDPERPTPARLHAALDGLESFSIEETPRVEDRGIWTWGYVIYDYRRFLDNMARLKMNMLTIWNDCPPLNVCEVIEYAHARGVRLILGFHWGWGLEHVSLARPEDRARIKEIVLRNYRQHYRGLGMDGIYFQTLTEHHETNLGGRSTASLACEMANDIAGALLELEPELDIWFGLHATSILDSYTDLAGLDQRVTIVWEDAGTIPYTYWPAACQHGGSPGTLDTLAQTIAYSRKLAVFRPESGFAMVPKGWSNLDWCDEFEHHGPFLLGVRGRDFTRERLRQRGPHWARVNALWIRNYRHAVRFYREVLACNPRRMSVTGLLEDGLFEERIQPSVALFAHTVWDPCRPEDEILDLALSPYYGKE